MSLAYSLNNIAPVTNAMHIKIIIPAALDTAIEPPSLYKKEKKKDK